MYAIQSATRPRRRCASRRVASVRGSALALLLAAPGAAQPSAEGAVSTLDEKPASASQAPVFTTACALTAGDLLTGHDCAGALDCLTAQSCDAAGGLDHVAAGTGLRNRGSGTIALAGAPPEAVAVGAWLYWGLIVASGGGTPGDPAAIVLAGQPLTGELVGAAPGPCWFGEAVGDTEFRAYRVAVLDQLVPGINGEYPVTVPSSSLTDGRDPWRGAPAPPPWIDGASLLVLYAHRDVPYDSRFYLHHGAALLAGCLELVHELPELQGVEPAPSLMRHTRLGGDGQRQAGYLPTHPFLTSIDWDPACSAQTSLQIRGPGSQIDTVSDWKGGDGGPLTQLWDTQVSEFRLLPQSPACGEYQVTYETLDPTAGSTCQETSSDFFHDCVVVVAHALTLR